MRIRVIKTNAPRLTRKLRVCAYVRVSTDSDEQEGSLDNQAQYFTDYINANPAWSSSYFMPTVAYRALRKTGRSFKGCSLMP